MHRRGRVVAAALAGILSASGTVVVAAGAAADLAAPPAFSHLPSRSDASALSMECDGRPPFAALHCRFTRVTVQPAAANPDAEGQMLAELDASWERLRATLDGMCPVEPDPAALEPAKHSAKAAMRAKGLAVWRGLCACRNAACVRAGLRSLAELGHGVCKASSHAFNLDFVRAGSERKWVAMSEPMGPCRLVVTATIELDPQDPGSAERWTYTETRLAGDSRGEPCTQSGIGESLVFSWRADRAALVECRSLEFGP